MNRPTNYNAFPSVFTLLTALFLFVNAAPVFSQSQTQTNFTISPPPLGYPEYPEEGTLYNRFDGSFISISNDDIDFKGIGMYYTPRYSFSQAAINCQIGIYNIFGSVGIGGSDTDINFVGLNITPNIEIQVFDFSDMSLILFAGYDFSTNRGSYMINNFTFDGTNYYDVTVYMNTSMYGPVAGMQMQMGMGEGLVFSPFFMIKKTGGKMTTSADPAFVYFENEYDIPSFTSMTYGFDILHEPSGVSLSGILQSSRASGESEDMRVTIISFGYSFK